MTTRARTRPLKLTPFRLVICVGCGCDDYHACEDAFGDPCYWLVLDRRSGKGVCSQCPERLDAWRHGDRTRMRHLKAR